MSDEAQVVELKRLNQALLSTVERLVERNERVNTETRALFSRRMAEEAVYRMEDRRVTLQGDFIPSGGGGTGGYTLPWMCRYTVVDKVVTLHAGYVFWGIRTLPVAEKSYTVANGDCFGIEITYSAGASEWTAAWAKHPLITDFHDTEESIAQFYYQFDCDDTQATIRNIGATGNWKIPSVFAPE